MKNENQLKEEVLSFVDNFVAKIPYFNEGEVVLECTDCETPLYKTVRETLHLEKLKPIDFMPIIPQTEKAENKVTCWKCHTTMSPFINYLNEGHKRDI